MDHTSKIKVTNVTKIFGQHPSQAIKLLREGKSKQEILEMAGMTVGVNQVNFDIRSGETFVIMGLSGSGKSTLVRMFNRLIDPTEGEIYIDGEEIVGMNKEQLRDIRRKKVGMVFQKFGLFPHKNILKNVEFGLEVQGVPAKERTEKALNALELVELASYKDRYPDQLSGGMQQRVGLARALANDPDILLMDEAFSALDPLIRKDMQNELIRLQATMHKTIIFITHDLDEALRIGDRIAIMKDGSMIQIGTAEEILLQPANDYVRKFVEDVDLFKVLKASNIQERIHMFDINLGAEKALQEMQALQQSHIFAMNSKKEFIGVITLAELTTAMKEGKPLETILNRNLPSVKPETLLVDLPDLVLNSKYPITVIDNKNNCTGIITKERLLSAMSNNKDKLNHVITISKKVEKARSLIEPKITSIAKGAF
ncbi:glycine betaine/L-proline ABC transporter ATP-binding protein [Niallia oryzisoli]|uniref:quaternary amine ABC transporter ATP-binding protein n=1 Tax=Niallia oryzisoli TaxID=1737571 RepID=UPI00373553A9